MNATADRIHMRVAQLAAAGASSAELAAAAGADWRAIEAALSPIVGGRGFVAIIDRSLHLSDELRSVAIGPDGDPVDAWQQSLSVRSAAEAVEASGRLLRVFCNLLGALVGDSLTERLLRPVWDRPTMGAGGQDITT